MNIEIVPVDNRHKSALRQLIELYSYDFSEYTKADVDEHGFYGYMDLDQYWTEDTKAPFFIKVNGKIAGFVLVGMSCKFTENESARSIQQFFVMRKYRGLNVGNFAAKYIFSLFKGEWEVRVLHTNKPALPFWNKVINEYSNGNNIYHSEPIPEWDGIAYTFYSH